MSFEQAILAVLVALIGASGGIVVERYRTRRNRRKEIDKSVATIERARITDDAQKRKEIDDAARDIREFLKKQVAELNDAIDKIEVTRADEREKWHQMLGGLSTKNLELELQHRRDKAQIDQMLEEAKVIDDLVKTLKTRVVVLEGEAMTLQARLEQCRKDRDQWKEAARSAVRDL